MKILLGAAIGDARGSMGGMTFSKGRFGAIARQKVSPVQPRSASVLTVRGLFADLSKSWASRLSDSDRAGWNSLAAISPRTNAFGNSYHMTGLQMYQSCNRSLDAIGGTRITAAPANLDITGLLTLSVAGDASAHTLAMTFTATPVPAGAAIVVQASIPQNAGRSFFGASLKQIKVIAAAATSPQALGVVYEAEFGVLRTGTKIQIRAFVVSTTTGAASTALSAEATVAA